MGLVWLRPKRGTEDSAASAASPKVAYLLRSYPRLSQTFIVDEILGVERLGVQVRLFSLTDPCEPVVQAEVGDVRASVRYLDRGAPRGLAGASAHARALVWGPGRYVATLLHVAFRKDLDTAIRTLVR